MAQEQIASLENLLLARPAVPDGPLPHLPPPNGHQELRAQMAFLTFHNGQGIRYLTQFGQEPRQINNQEIYYTFQGLTADRAYYVAAFFPVRSATLPDKMDVADREPFSTSVGSANAHAAYLVETTAALEQLTPDVFTPDLTILDAVVNSLHVAPTVAIPTTPSAGPSPDIGAGPAAPIAMPTASPAPSPTIVATQTRAAATISDGAEGWNGGCLDNSPATVISPAGRLRVVYEEEGQWWEWREETGDAVSVEPESTPPPAAGDLLSADGQFLASLRRPEEGSFELWVSAADGSNARRLITITPDEVYERYPQARDVGLAFGWAGVTNLLSYRLAPEFDGLGGVPAQAIQIIDPRDGQSWTILPPDVAWAHQFINGGHQLAALSADGLQIIDTIDGALRHDIAREVVAPWDQGLTFTPDGKRIFVYTASGISLINPADGAVTDVAIQYLPVGAGHYSILPPVDWLENGYQFYTLTTTDPDVWGNTEATFSVWLVDVATATPTVAPSATLLSTFTGFYPSAVPSPGYRWIAFWPQSRDNRRQLHLADTGSGHRPGGHRSGGEQILYDELYLLEFIGWSPDGRQFLYKAADATQPIVGHICAPPQPLTGVDIAVNADIQWVDAQRLLVLAGPPASGEGRPLRLVGVGGANAGQETLIATLSGDYPHFRAHFEE